MVNIDFKSAAARSSLPLPADQDDERPPLRLARAQAGDIQDWFRAPAPRPDTWPWLGYRRMGKRVLDILLVLAAAPVYVPIIAVAALCLLIEGGQPFYRQKRLGRDGREFSIVKLRTMTRNADQRLKELLAGDPELKREWDVAQKLRNDPRITRVGAFLRSTSIDELPQLWNVLVGEMSLVGPRPMMPGQLKIYGHPAAYFALRPGITGPWQVGRRNETSFSERAFYDAAYFTEISLAKDIRLLFRTVGVVLKRTGN